LLVVGVGVEVGVEVEEDTLFLCSCTEAN